MKTIYLFLITSFVCFLFHMQIQAQQIISRTMPFLEQLSLNSIGNIYQDRDGFVWMATFNGLIRYDGYQVQEFRNNFETPNRLSHNNIFCFTETDRYLWVGTEKGLNLIDKTTYRVIPFPDEKIQESRIFHLLTDLHGNVWCASDNIIYLCSADLTVVRIYSISFSLSHIYEDEYGNIWLLSPGNGIFKYERISDRFINYPPVGKTNQGYRICQDAQMRYWIATWGEGIWRFDPGAPVEEMFVRQPVDNPIRHQPEGVFFDIVQDNAYGYLWALSHFGLYVLKINEQGSLEIVDINKLPECVHEVDLYKSYSRIIKDWSGNLWLAAFDEGYIISFRENRVENYLLEDIKKTVSLDANIIRLIKDQEGILWFNQARYGLCLFDEKTGRISYGLREGKSRSVDFITINPSRTGDAMWVGGREGYHTMVWKMKQHNMRIAVLEETDLRQVVSSPGEIVKLSEDGAGNLWVGTTQHLFVKPAGKEEFEVVSFPVTGIRDLEEDGQGNILIVTQRGIYRFCYSGEAVLLADYSGKIVLPETDYITGFCTDAEDNIWYATSHGSLFHFNPQQQQVTNQTTACNLKGEMILNVLSKDENVWIIYNKYIVRHDRIGGKNSIYSVTDDNILIPLFRYGSAFLDTDGSLYASGHKGVVKISPESFVLPSVSERNVLVTDIRVNNRSLLFDTSHQDADNSIHGVTLLPDARNIEVFFSSFDYTSAPKNKYMYKLEGCDMKWTYVDNGRHSAFYNRLDKGRYTLRIKWADAYGNWSEEKEVLTIHRLPAFYETRMAYLFYFLIVALSVFICLKSWSRRIEKRNMVMFHEELTQAKLNYFTNITHELLTPLTILSCVADDLEKNETHSEKQAGILRTNVNRLKRLLQQVLDFRKVESNKMPLKVNKGNVSVFVQTLIASNFQALARQKNIRLLSDIEKNIWGYLDFDKLDKILFNLLSNAIKYTPEYKNVFVKSYCIVHEGFRVLRIEVEDEGIGIADKDIKHIFTKFYSDKKHLGYESNGIGLSLTKELISLHHGTIEVTSSLNKGSVFMIELPIDKELYREEEVYESVAVKDVKTEEICREEEADSTPRILFVDDNEDLRELMWDILHDEYRIVTAENGEEGLKVLETNPVDIIICDVMMPEMDGLEFCRRVKGNAQTSHIPVLMLTAKNALEDQVDCYKAGAEGYIAKPFEMKILQARLENLLQARELRQKSFRSKMSLNISNLDYQTTDEKFLNDAMRCVEEHLSEPDFDIPQMAAKLSMSRNTLNRKFRTITGMTPLDFIRNVKLKHACMLLKKKTVNVSEVAYATGFSTPKYFTKCFKDEFGITPSEFVRK